MLDDQTTEMIYDKMEINTNKRLKTMGRCQNTTKSSVKATNGS